jgi:hypothetical protein
MSTSTPQSPAHGSVSRMRSPGPWKSSESPSRSPRAALEPSRSPGRASPPPVQLAALRFSTQSHAQAPQRAAEAVSDVAERGWLAPAMNVARFCVPRDGGAQLGAGMLVRLPLMAVANKLTARGWALPVTVVAGAGGALTYDPPSTCDGPSPRLEDVAVPCEGAAVGHPGGTFAITIWADSSSRAARASMSAVPTFDDRRACPCAGFGPVRRLRGVGQFP